MGWINRHIISIISPSWALERERKSRGLRAFYEAAEPSRLRKNRAKRQSANVENQFAAEKLRDSARHLEQNLDIASGALDVLVSNTVGTGIQPEPQMELTGGDLAEDINRKLATLWDDWIHTPEVTWQLDYYSLQRLIARSLFRDGEIFCQKIIGNVPQLDHGTTVPYSLEALESDFVPYQHTDFASGVIQGIQTNAWGRPRNYFVYKSHPGEYLTSPALKSVSADRLLHLKIVKRFHQLRGISVFASVMNRLDDIKEIDESERVAARVAAAMAAYIKKGTPDMYEAEELGVDGTTEPRTMEWEPGMIFDDLQMGEDIGTIDPKRPNNALIPFRDSQLRMAASGFGASYSSLSKNYNGTYSAQRQELVEQFVNYRTISSMLIFRLCQPVWDGFIDACLASGKIVLPANVNKETIYNATHTPPPMPWIDPLREVEANEIMEARGYKSRPRIIRERGDNPDQVDREIIRDKAYREKNGLKFGPAKDTPSQSNQSTTSSQNQ